MAALFSLWSAYKSNTFLGIAAASPSVWFSGWEEFMNNNTPLSNTIYLSLGDTEEKTKNKVMCAVGVSDSGIRVAKAFAWCIENLC